MIRRLLIVLSVAAVCPVAGTAQQSPHGALQVPCERCHTTGGWTTLASPLLFSHDSTEFRLEGQHVQVACRQCHASLEFGRASTQCAGCHQDIHRGELGKDCERCHTPRTWLAPEMADRHRDTRFPLLGAHRTAPCRSCHPNEQKYEFAGTPTTCFECHRNEYRSAAAPNHLSAGFGTDCVQCHAPTALTWGGSFDHSQTAFPLAGAHRAVPCIQCHAGDRFRGAPVQCNGCHQGDYTAAAAPKHTPPGFSTDCTSCHSTSAWRPASFNHTATAFPLTGAHVQTACASCHISGQYAGLPVTCWGCHQSAFSGTTAPSHTAAGFPQDCLLCHTTAAWQPSSFNHATTVFPLTGAHAAVPCVQCHKNNVYKGTPAACNSCHQGDYAAALTPKHSLPSFSTDCTVCHNTAAWSPSSFSHGTTRFPLTGAHVTTLCANCHVNAVYAGTPLTCVGCHQQQYNSAANPNHAASGFPTDCQSCHSTTAWQPSTFDHAKTLFPLTGAHLATPCNQCHLNNVYKGTATQCVACHQQDYTAAANPKHTLPSFSNDCTVCHTTTAWRPSSFDHSKTSYPLTGAHVQAACSTCHVNGQYAGTSTQCSGCHTGQYTATTNPNHLAAGFPNDCALCHSTTAWSPSSYNHDPYFPIGATATHRPGRWTTCADCHTAPSDFSIFSCINCHTHDKATTDSHHTQVRNYTYDSPSCYRCHPKGSSD